MAHTTGSEAQARDNIVRHMNRDHQDSLMRYLQHYCRVSSFKARNARLTAVSLSSLSLTANPSSSTGEYTVPLDPPLSSWSEARERLVAMDADCTAALGVDRITIREFSSTRGWHLYAVFVPVLITVAACCWRGNFAPDAASWNPFRRFSAAFPEVAARMAERQRRVLVTLFGLHALEALWMDRSRLRKYNVPRGGALWWTWMLSTLFEGFPNFFRFDALVEEKRKRIEGKKH